MAIQGNNLSDKNLRLRYLMIFFGGLIMFGAVYYWRNATLDHAEYVEMPVHRSTSALQAELRSSNYQVDVQDSSPSVK